MIHRILCIAVLLALVPSVVFVVNGNKSFADAHAQSATAQLDTDELLGVWEATATYAEPTSMDLKVNKVRSGLEVSINGRTLSLTQNGKSSQFVANHESGKLKGTYDPTSGSFFGHWIQPTTANTSYPYAIPVRFNKVKANTWTATVETKADQMRYYLCISQNSEGRIEGYFRNPERNNGVRWGYLNVKTTGDQVEFTNEKSRTLITGKVSLVNGQKTIAMQLPNSSDTTFKFKKSVRRPDSAFYASADPAVYKYETPQQLDDGWNAKPASDDGMDQRKLALLVNDIRSTQVTSLTTPYIHSVLVARRGNLVLEEYFYGYDREHLHDTRSAGKSIASMLVGTVADRNESLDEHTTIDSIFMEDFKEPHPEIQTPAFRKRQQMRSKITIGQALSMQSGLDADDNNQESLGGEDRMQDQEEIGDWVKFILGVPMSHEPGSRATYGSNNINLASAAVARFTSRWLPDLFDEYLARPLGIKQYYFNLDPSGNGYMGGGIRLTARDQLKLGQVMLDRGLWNGQRILSEQWVEESTKAQSSIHEPKDYGFAWWRKTLQVGDVSVDVFHASGNGGQLIVCVPKHDLVIQISGGNYRDFTTWYRSLTNLIPEYILGAIQDSDRINNSVQDVENQSKTPDAETPDKLPSMSPEDFGYSKFKLATDLGEVQYFVSTNGQPLVKTEQKPVVLFLQGSGPTPIFFGSGNRIGSSIMYDARDFPDSHFVIVSKPGIDFHDSELLVESEEYDQKLSLEYRVNSVDAVINELQTQKWVDTSHLVLIGHSEGADVAPRVAVKNAAVTHLAVLAPGAFSQMFEFTLMVRKQIAKGELSRNDGDTQIEELLEAYCDIFANPTDHSKKWKGHTYLRWSTFFEPAMDSYLKVSVPVFAAVAEFDQSTPAESGEAILLEYIRHNKSNLTYKNWPTDHQFQEVNESGEFIDRRLAVLDELNSWINSQ